MKKEIFLPIVLSIIFFTAGFLTLNAYGTSWDETLHFSRGHAYLNYYLTGTKEYPKNEQRKSFYQLDYQNGDFWFKDNGGHPPINGTLAALSNYIFYQKLNLLGDIQSHHLFNIFISSVLVFVICYFALITFGRFAAIISTIALVTYPLFWAESHFNVKDPAETAFFALTILMFYLYEKTKQTKWIIFFFISFGIGLGIKFNILFLPLIILIYLALKKFLFKENPFKNISSKHLITIFLIGPIIGLAIFIITWPYLWNDTLNQLLQVFGYYKQIGTGANYQPGSFYIFGFNTFPTQWILYTTPPLLLVLTFIGIISLKNSLKKDSASLLWLIWLIIPIMRATVPGSSIYGGDRQIMEFLPAFCLLSGLGAWQVTQWVKKIKDERKLLLIQASLICLFIFPILVLFKLHPNENVYFNFLMGGLKGAYEKNFPSWGNSYGNAYYQGIQWLNENAPKDSRIALIQGTITNSPIILFRSDLKLGASYWSGLEKKGEYLMELTFSDTGKAYYYTWEYVDRFLVPVYELKVDGVAILKIWKNDIEHFKDEYKNIKKEVYNRRLHAVSLRDNGSIKDTKVDNKLIADLGEEVELSKAILNFEKSDTCIPINALVIETSKNKKDWLREGDSMPFPQINNKSNLEGNSLTVYFAGKKARYIRFLFDSNKSCGLINPAIEVYQLY